jgi:hypothetical protein
MGAVILHAVERGPVGLDTIQHAVDDPGDALLEPLDPLRRNAGINRQRTRACCSPSICVTNCASMIFVELLPARATRHLRRERLRIGENLVQVDVSVDDHLRVNVAQHVERRSPRPFGMCPCAFRLNSALPRSMSKMLLLSRSAGDNNSSPKTHYRVAHDTPYPIARSRSVSSSEGRRGKPGGL